MVDIEDENIKTLFELRPIHFVHYFEFLVFKTENVMAGAKATGYRSNSLLAYKRSISFTCHCAMTLTCILKWGKSFDIIGALSFGTQYRNW